MVLVLLVLLVVASSCVSSSCAVIWCCHRFQLERPVLRPGHERGAAVTVKSVAAGRVVFGPRRSTSTGTGTTRTRGRRGVGGPPPAHPQQPERHGEDVPQALTLLVQEVRQLLQPRGRSRNEKP